MLARLRRSWVLTRDRRVGMWCEVLRGAECYGLEAKAERQRLRRAKILGSSKSLTRE
ncbi:protein of unknown function [Denitratisoma oestradiolicum]|uniref:Uncharacterized protein n=1 Tax=Denitratisoma oestradiolicum TaxID=311182 RepID=A0A6S6XVU4_9PROT|nr:protein of unknown function [Denitratisoma oestradiolicum]CAB1369961.1 protein of unknown function [Denitratisoma oestradiolicum]CAB1370099.1 protein of unknown function [Denitratisoma oestradiolicum]